MSGNPEIAAMQSELSLLRDLCRQHEADREAKDYYERLLAEIGSSIGCGHIDDRLPSCVSSIAKQQQEAAEFIKQIVARNGITPQGVQTLETWLKENELGGMRRG